MSILEKYRSTYVPELPYIFREFGARVGIIEDDATDTQDLEDLIRTSFTHTVNNPRVSFRKNNAPASKRLTVGVIFSGGQASGGHNVIAGLFDGLKSLNVENRLLGFRNGPDGLLSNDNFEITKEILTEYRNTGGFDLIGSGRTKLESHEQFDRVEASCRASGINAIVVIGGDDSNTNAGVLAEYFLAKNAGIQVVGCPKTIDGDLKNEWIEISFGFDTASKVFSGLIGNLCRDALSAKKYWHFVKLMGRSASHVTLECALQTHANISLISEEVSDKKQTLEEIVRYVSDIVAKRAANGMNYGIALIPEGLIEFIPEMKTLIAELNDLLAVNSELSDVLAAARTESDVTSTGLTAESAAAYFALPPSIRMQLVLDRDPHGNVQVSKIETENLLIQKVQEQLMRMEASGTYCGKFSGQNHFYGYEGRCAAPSNFDATYCYVLGFTGATLIGGGLTAYIASARNLSASVKDWEPLGIPIPSLMNVERRHGKNKPVIRKALVELDGAPFEYFAARRDRWAMEDHYCSPGGIQYFGNKEISDQTTITLGLENGCVIE